MEKVSSLKEARAKSLNDEWKLFIKSTKVVVKQLIAKFLEKKKKRNNKKI
ncbi:hypothetical protein K6959_10595 [Bacillus aquiflavi]|nr:hypothetical protein [Bacillus aquiflavi]UAC47186.1 hypothetical protein K6959_10595 [Bacillus aquiflavi]